MNDQVILNWATASEENNKYFEVERSSNGAVFHKIGTVTGAGNSTATNHYQFIDKAPLKGASYYRLKQVDIDGKFTYSSIRRVNIDSKGFNYRILQNPVNDELRLNFEMEKPATLRIDIRDVNGRLLIKREERFEAGLTTYGLSLGSLANGTYIVNVITANSNEAKIFVKQ